MKQERFLTPDIGRGFMLLFIAVAHAPLLLMNLESSYFPSVDRIVQFLVVTFVDSRAYIMFSLFFGLGFVFMVQRQLDRGVSDKLVKASVRRRSIFLILFGFIHLVFIGAIDILAFYGAAGLIVGWTLFKPYQLQKRVLIITGIIYLIMIPVVWLLLGQVFLTEEVYIPGSYMESVIVNLFGFPVVMLGQMFMYPSLVIILIGVWAARKEWITHPDKHRPLLKKVAWIGICVSVLGALPFALTSVNVWEPPATYLSVFAIMHIFTGVFGGLGYTALIALFSATFKRAVPRVARALSSVGKRSLTFYLYQEALLVILLSQLWLGLGSTIGYTGAFVSAILVWFIGCLLAVWLEKNEKQGPAEMLLRRLIYKKRIKEIG